jgi:hypothetical protein
MNAQGFGSEVQDVCSFALFWIVWQKRRERERERGEKQRERETERDREIGREEKREGGITGKMTEEGGRNEMGIRN